MSARVHDRCLVVNADDFGLSPGVNRGIVDACEHGIVTSASLLVRGAAAEQAAAYARARPHLPLGLHLDLGEWAWRDGEWVARYRVVRLDDASAVEAEVARQLSLFRDLTGGEPSHLDSHQHVHRADPVRSVMARLAARLAVPLRHLTPDITYCGRFYGQTAKGEPLPAAITVASLEQILRSLTAAVTELACHPGYADELADTTYQAERGQEVRTLCDPAIRELIRHDAMRLCSFGDLVRQ